MDDYQHLIHLSRYAKWIPAESRRETWEETVDRYINFWKERYPYLSKELDQAHKYVLDMKVMPSMRCMMTAGPALDRDNVAGYNCSYITISRPAAFSEIMYILMCGTGVGFSVERQYISELPTIAEDFHDSETTITVADSRIGWAKAFKELVGLLYAGQVPKWDLSKIRPAGEPLKTFGGRASGPEPLDDLFNYTVAVFRNGAGRKLNSLEVHDLVCKTAEIVVVGGVRRSALLSLSNLTDRRMVECKLGNWHVTAPHRAMANNSVAYTEKPDVGAFLSEWKNLIDSKAGERGLFNRAGIQTSMARLAPRRDPDYDFGTNPCSEIILRDRQFCNLTEVIARADDTLEDLANKVAVASFLGTLQSSLTNFRFLSKEWRKNCEEERLLGVSISGWMDHPTLSEADSATLEMLRDQAIEVNHHTARKIKVAPSKAVTCVKPSGTVSQLVDCASGIHPRYSEYYIRNVRMDNKDPITQFLIEQGVPYEVDSWNSSATVFSFYMKAPDNAITRTDRSALDQLKHWVKVQQHWCEHKPSITVYVKDNEWLEIANFVYNNFDYMSGVSFLPHTDHMYKQAPYIEISKEEYDAAPKITIDWDKFVESVDTTSASQEIACTAGACEI